MSSSSRAAARLVRRSSEAAPATAPAFWMVCRLKVLKNSRRVGSWSGSVARRAIRRRFSVLDDAVREVVAQPFAALEEEQLDQERETDDLRLERLDQLDC